MHNYLSAICVLSAVQYIEDDSIPASWSFQSNHPEGDCPQFSYKNERWEGGGAATCMLDVTVKLVCD